MSKNRPAQLDLTLRSLFAMAAKPEHLSVSVWHCFDPGFAEGYALVQRYHPSVHFSLQRPASPIKAQLLELIAMKEAAFFAFFVDDMVFIRPFSLKDRPFQLLAREIDLCAVSLRLHPGVNYSQPLSLKTPPPPLDRHNRWSWVPRNLWVERILKRLGRFPASGDWRLQLTPDGNVYRYRDFKAYFESLPELPHINKLEWMGLVHPMKGSRLVCYNEPRAIAVAMNSVDPTSAYPSGDTSPEELNREFLAGKRLSYEPLEGLLHPSCHLIRPPTWISANGGTY